MRVTGPFFAMILLAALARGDAGLAPRAAGSEYDVHHAVSDGIIAATMLAPGAVAKIFSPDVSRHYLVLEIGVYPEIGIAMDVGPDSFILKAADDSSFPSTPVEVAWHGKRPSGVSQAPQIAGEIGVAFGGPRVNPATGQTQSGTAVWGALAVGTAPRPNSPNANSNTVVLEDKLRAMELPAGQTQRPVAGYLYFPVPRQKTKLVLEYSRNGERVSLPVPVQ